MLDCTFSLKPCYCLLHPNYQILWLTMSSLLLLPWLCFFSGPVTGALYASGFTSSKPATVIHLCRIILFWFKGLLPDAGILEGEGALFKRVPCQGLRKAWALDGKSLCEFSLPSTPSYKAQSWSPVWTSSRNAVHLTQQQTRCNGPVMRRPHCWGAQDLWFFWKSLKRDVRLVLRWRITLGLTKKHTSSLFLPHKGNLLLLCCTISPPWMNLAGFCFHSRCTMNMKFPIKGERCGGRKLWRQLRLVLFR